MDSNDQTKIKLTGPTIRMAQSVMNECRKAGVPIFHKWTAIDLCKMISVQLYAQQIDPVFDIEDVLNSLLYDRVVEGNTRSIQSYTSWFLQRAGNHKSYANHNAQREEIPGEIPEDDAEEQDPHDMQRVACPSPEAGSDMHIALMDVREHLGDKYVDVMECKLAGVAVSDIALPRVAGTDENFDSYDKAERAVTKVNDFLRSGGYHLDTANRRLGCNSPIGQKETFFPAENSRNDLVHNRNDEVDHRCHYDGRYYRADYNVSYSRDSEHSITPLNGELVTKYVSGQVPKVTCPKYGEIIKIEITNQTANQYLTRCGTKGLTLVAPGFQEDKRKGIDSLSKKS